MALVKCSECGREISDKAMTCPRCDNEKPGPFNIFHISMGAKRGNRIGPTAQGRNPVIIRASMVILSFALVFFLSGKSQSKTGEELSLATVSGKKPLWLKSLKEYLPGRVILEDGKFFDYEKVRLTEPPLVEISNVKIKKSKDLGKTVFIATGFIRGASGLKKVVGEKVFVSLEGMVFEKGGLIPGFPCVWGQNGFLQWIKPGEKKTFNLIGSIPFRDQLLKGEGTLTLIAYTSNLVLKGSEDAAVQYYILGGEAVGFRYKK